MDSLTIDATIDALDPVTDYVLEAAALATLDKKATYGLRLAVDELVTNIISYAYAQHHEPGKITLKFEITDEKLTLTLEDSGVEFNPFNIVDQEEAWIDVPLEERPIGGLGIYLASISVDSTVYQRIGDLNQTTLVIGRHTICAEKQ